MLQLELFDILKEFVRTVWCFLEAFLQDDNKWIFKQSSGFEMKVLSPQLKNIYSLIKW